MTAFYQAGPSSPSVSVGHTVPIGEGWFDGSPLDVLLVSLPYLWGPQLEHCQLSGRHIQVLWLIPISAAELVFQQTNGTEALEQRFEATHRSTTWTRSGRRRGRKQRRRSRRSVIGSRCTRIWFSSSGRGWAIEIAAVVPASWSWWRSGPCG